MSLVCKTAPICNLYDANIGLHEQLFRALDASLENLAMWCHASCCMKNAEKMTAAVAALGRELQKRGIGVQMAFDELLNLSQSPS